MSNFLSEKLNTLNVFKNSKQTSLANYRPYVITKNLVFISGQLPIKEKTLLHTGKVGKNISIVETKKSLEIATYNLLWTLSDAIDEYKNVKNTKCINLKGYLNCINNFDEHSLLFNTASDIIIEILGVENGSHSRSVIGVNSLPKNSPVEIDGVFSLIK
ncbi:MAG: hypothetical protein CL572_06835 [Alphaproteobacteria bacterium]|nr:hypothetical protein [Alphaproteobacteria bacterium]|tara:strand:+ start:594 stop:1070 length:477 start_codon:yes stop_codon:yes gene_type:complete